MKVRLSQGRVARARTERKPPDPNLLTPAFCWPRFVRMLDEEGVIDVDVPIECYGFRFTGLDQAWGGDL